MQERNREEFVHMLEGMSQLYAMRLGVEGISLWWAALARYPIERISVAFSAHVTDGALGRFVPKPADIIARLQKDDGHPGAEEAWSLLRSALADEGVTVVWTELMKDAFFVATGLSDDPIAARMAFKERYGTVLSAAREMGISPVWQVSLGQDKSGQFGPIQEAVRKGRILLLYAQSLLPLSEFQLADKKQAKLTHQVDTVESQHRIED